MAWYGRRRGGEERVGARAVVVGAGIFMVGVLAVQTSDVVRDAIDSTRPPMDGAAASLASWSAGAAGWSIGFGTSAKDKDRIRQLEEEVRSLHRWRDLAETMALRMESYEKLLNLMGEVEGEGVTARVVAETDGPFAATRIANAGADQGVKEGFAVVNEYGLVGRVIRVGKKTSRILLVTDFSSRIPVKGAQSGDNALMVGDRGEGARLSEPETPEKIVDGEMWVTSGEDGQTPLGVKVGRARRDKDGSWRIELAMKEAPVDFVRLLPPPDFAKPETDPVAATVSPNTDNSLMSSGGPAGAPAATPTPASAPAQRPKPRPTPAPAESPTPTTPTPGGAGQ